MKILIACLIILAPILGAFAQSSDRLGDGIAGYSREQILEMLQYGRANMDAVMAVIEGANFGEATKDMLKAELQAVKDNPEELQAELEKLKALLLERTSDGIAGYSQEQILAMLQEGQARLPELIAVVEASALVPQTKQQLVADLEAAKSNPQLVQPALEKVKAALGL
jgi:hypothetical protein